MSQNGCELTINNATIETQISIYNYFTSHYL